MTGTWFFRTAYEMGLSQQSSHSFAPGEHGIWCSDDHYFIGTDRRSFEAAWLPN